MPNDNILLSTFLLTYWDFKSATDIIVEMHYATEYFYTGGSNPHYQHYRETTGWVCDKGRINI